MDVFELGRRLVDDYERYIRSFILICDDRIRDEVHDNRRGGIRWPEPRIGLKPPFARSREVDDLVDDVRLHDECSRIRLKPQDGSDRALTFHRHQVEPIGAARSSANCVLTTGTGSGRTGRIP